MIKAWLEGPRNTSDQRVSMPHQHHAAAKDIPVEIDHALAVTPQCPLALQPVIQEIDIGFVMIGNLGVCDWQILCPFKAKAFNRLANAVFPPDKDRIAIAGIAERQRGANDFFFLAFGKDNAFFLRADPVKDALQRRGSRIEARGQIALIAGNILNRLSGNAAVHCCLGNGG